MRLPADDLNDVSARVSASVGNALRGTTVFVTGAAGLIGRWLVESLCFMNSSLGLDATVVVLTTNQERFRTNAPHLFSDPAVLTIEGNLTMLRECEIQCDFLIHGATASSRQMAADSFYFVNTIEGTRDALEFAIRAGVRRFLYLSSGAVYGRQPPSVLTVPESFSGAPDLCDPASAYGEGKRAAELLCASYRNAIESVIARIFAVVGPLIPLKGKFAVGDFLGDALDGAPISVHGDGSTVRSYQYMSDLLVWLWVLLLKGRSGYAYNVGSDDAVSILELARHAARLVEPPLAVTTGPTNVVPIDRYVPSTEMARSELGLENTIDWRSALRKTFDWYLAKRAAEACRSVE